MKKLLCMTLTLLLLCSLLPVPGVSAAEDLVPLFDDAINRLRWQGLAWDVPQGEAFPVKTVMGYTKQLLCIDEYGEDLVEGDGYSYYATYAIPADVFEAAAMDSFAMVDVEALRSYTSFFWDHENFTGIDNFQNYQPDRQVYLFSSSGGMGDPSWYEVLGYTQEDGLYTVYSRFVSLLWDGPVGVEGEDYILIDGEPFAIEHYLRTVVSISNGHVQFHSWEEVASAPDFEEPSLVVVAQNEFVTIEAMTGVFPEDAVIEIAAADEQLQALVQQSLEGLVAAFTAFDITATEQPDGSVQLTFAIPEGYAAEELALFYISEDGLAQQLEATVDAEAGTITAEVTHFSVYAVAQLAKEEALVGDVNGDQAVNARDARLLLRYLAGLIDEEALNLALADVNGDEKINARDARAILRQIAGLDF